MPICRDCHGAGQREIRKEVTTLCPNCHGAKRLPNGAECKSCDKWGQIGTGKFTVQKKLCQTCLGSGKVSEGSLTTWFLVWVVPTTLIVLGGGGVGIWAAWTFLQNPWITAVIAVLFFSGWGGLISYFITRMPSLGEISPVTWFFIRAIPTTLVALGAGGPIVWASWVALANVLVAATLAIVVFAVWGVVMFYFISHMPE